MLNHIVWLTIITFVTYLRSLFNGFISDDTTVHGRFKASGYKKNKDSHGSFLHQPIMWLHNWTWRIFKDKAIYHHLLSVSIYIATVVSFYFVGCKFFQPNVMFVSAILFAVHPCNAQVSGWISGRFYCISTLIGVWAFYFNSILLYLSTFLISVNIFFLPLIMDIPWQTKVISICASLLVIIRILKNKTGGTKKEGWFKKDNTHFKLWKPIVALKSLCYYFTFAMMPIKMGWFHEIGEPIDDDLKSINLHFCLCVALVLTMGSVYFFHPQAFMGLLLFVLFIAPFSNLITLALFTSERYMTPAIMGWSLFLGHILTPYPTVVAVLATIYFMRTQLELWAYKSDFRLALYSLLNFNTSGFAWSNIAVLLLGRNKPSSAFDVLKQGLETCPEFPTMYYHLYTMYRAVDLLCDFDKALYYLERACKYGKHQAWYAELEEFKATLKTDRVKQFKEKCFDSRITAVREPRSEPGVEEVSERLVGAVV